MKNAFPIQCPNCTSMDTLRIKGPEGLCESCIMQRHQCRTCGQKFLVFWEHTSTRLYGAEPRLEGADDMPILDAEYSPAEVADAGA